jgi:ribosomal protein S18 acetylase RimI-like enzyme
MITPLSADNFTDFSFLLEKAGQEQWHQGQWLALFREGKLLHSCLVWDDQKPAGYVICQTVENEIEILDLFILPEYRRKGYGLALMNNLLHTIPDIKKCFLEVDVENYPAITLYKRCGFKLKCHRKNYYRNGHDAALYSYPI